jgi:uncharacterized membrane protein
MERRVARFLTSAAILWAAAIFLAPVAHARHAGGRLPETVRIAGSLVCHQRVERTFWIGGSPMPVCARCTGIYLSGALGALAAWLSVPVMPRRTRKAILAAAVPTAVTIGVEWAGVMQPGNAMRAVAAVPIGAACGWIFVRLLRAEAAACVIIS